MRNLQNWTGWILVCLLLSACAATVPPPSPTDNHETGKDLPFLVYERSGGIAGVSVKWEFFSDGTVISGDGKEKKLDSATLQSLQAMFQMANMEKLTQAATPQPCADCFLVTLTWIDSGKTWRITLVPEAQNADTAALKLIESVENALR